MLEWCKHCNTEDNLAENQRGFRKWTQYRKSGTEWGRTGKHVSKIPGSLHCGVKDVNDCLNCDRDDPGYHIMTDDEIVNNISEERQGRWRWWRGLDKAMLFKRWT